VAIVPELNAVYEYRRCGTGVLQTRREESWVTWSPEAVTANGKRIDGDAYMVQQMARFSEFIARPEPPNSLYSICSPGKVGNGNCDVSGLIEGTPF
jgi:hypothetical protein